MVTFANERKPIHIVNTRHSTITHKRYISHEIRAKGANQMRSFAVRGGRDDPAGWMAGCLLLLLFLPLLCLPSYLLPGPVHAGFSSLSHSASIVAETSSITPRIQRIYVII